MAIWLLMSNLPDVQLLIYGLLIHYVFWLWASDFYMWNDICYSNNPPPVLCLYTMRVVQIVRRNLVIVSHTSYYISHAGKTGTWCRMAYGFMHNICFYMRLNGYTGSLNWLPCLQIGLLFHLEIGFFTGRNRRTYLACGISVCAGVLGLCAFSSNIKWPVHCTLDES